MVQDPQPILVETRGRVGLVTLNRPRQLNALNDALMDALGEALLAFDADAGIGAIVITGSDKAFAAGADIDAMVGWDYAEASRRAFITRNWETIRRIRKHFESDGETPEIITTIHGEGYRFCGTLETA